MPILPISVPPLWVFSSSNSKAHKTHVRRFLCLSLGTYRKCMPINTSHWKFQECDLIHPPRIYTYLLYWLLWMEWSRIIGTDTMCLFKDPGLSVQTQYVFYFWDRRPITLLRSVTVSCRSAKIPRTLHALGQWVGIAPKKPNPSPRPWLTRPRPTPILAWSVDSWKPLVHIIQIKCTSLQGPAFSF